MGGGESGERFTWPERGLIVLCLALAVLGSALLGSGVVLIVSDDSPGPPVRPEPYCEGTTRVWQVEGDLELQAWAPECLPTTTVNPDQEG